MKRIVGYWSTEVIMEEDEPREICRLGQGEKCCAFLAVSRDEFVCIRMDYPTNSSIFSRLKEGTMNAKGKGGWEGCAWEGRI